MTRLCVLEGAFRNVYFGFDNLILNCGLQPGMYSEVRLFQDHLQIPSRDLNETKLIIKFVNNVLSFPPEGFL